MVFFLKLIFILSLFILFYVYLGYLILVFLFAIIRNREVRKDVIKPYVTILIAAYNEEDSIEASLNNKLALDYPKEKLEIIVISDGSTDQTNDLVNKYKHQGIRLLKQEPRSGKTAALNMAVPQAKGEIIVFSDANSMYDPKALEMLVQNFNDLDIGYVTGKMIYTNPDGSTIGKGCTTYMKYENYLRQLETRVGSVVGVDGGIDAVRKVLYKPMNLDQLPDFVLPLKVVEQGYRVVYEPRAILKEPSLKASKDEYKMRVRVSLRALWALSDMRQMLAFKKYRLFSWQLWSHKVLRYLCFIFLITAYLSNLFVWSEGINYKVFFILQNMAYLGAIMSPVLEKRGYRFTLLYLLNYFMLLNLAAAHAFIKFIFGQKQVVWTPRKG
jgi:cellulose synthase/poly-beta-1,6-N-acetylglucosamine synthase-like glycosyltransferase